MSDEERERLLEAGWRAAASLPPISPECARRVAELLREPVNRFVAAQRAKERGELMPDTRKRRALVERIEADLAEQHLAPDARESELLAHARTTADRIASPE